MEQDDKQGLSVQLATLKQELERVHGLPASVEQHSDTTAWIFVENYEEQYLYDIAKAIEILRKYPDNYSKQDSWRALEVVEDLEDSGGFLYESRDFPE